VESRYAAIPAAQAVVARVHRGKCTRLGFMSLMVPYIQSVSRSSDIYTMWAIWTICQNFVIHSIYTN